MLQVVKFNLQSDHLSFSEHWVANTADLAALTAEEWGISAEDCTTLMTEGDIEGLWECLQLFTEAFTSNAVASDTQTHVQNVS